MPQDLIDRTGRVINAPNRLKLHARADLESAQLGWLDNGTRFRIKGVQGKFYHIVVLKGDHAGKMGFVWKEQGRDLDSGKYYVELDPLDTPEPYEQPPARTEAWLWWAAGGFLAALAFAVYSCGGPV